MRQKQKFLSIIVLVMILSAFVGALKFEGINFQAGVMRNMRKVAVKIAPKPAPSLLISVKFHKQEHALSCEAAALKMALAFRGIEVSEAELMHQVGFDPTEEQEGVWGDPQKAFVGNIDGKMMKDGYGVYWYPIARVANEYRYTVAFEGMTVDALAAELQNGNPVIIWGHLLSGKEYFWKTQDGRDIKAILGEHTKFVIGYAGDPQNPEGFFLLDPIYGEIYETTQKLLDEWGKLDFGAVVVY